VRISICIKNHYFCSLACDLSVSLHIENVTTVGSICVYQSLSCIYAPGIVCDFQDNRNR